MDELNTEISVLQSHLDGLLTCIRLNDLKQHRFQSLEMNLLSLNSLSELIPHVLDETKMVFALERVSLNLVDEKKELSRYLQEHGMHPKKTSNVLLLENEEPLRLLFGKSVKPYLGPYHERKGIRLFSKTEIEPSSIAVIPLYRRGRFLGSLNLGSIDPDRFSPTMATDFIERLACVLSVCLENTLNNELLRRTSLIDSLTGVNNRRFFDQRMREEVDRARRSGDSLGCLFLDIDHFKSVNDTFGHPVGDLVLANVAGEIRSQLRNNDVLARYGGEEFVALLGGANEQKALEIAERIRLSVEKHRLDTKDRQAIFVTISIGVAAFEPKHRNTKKNIDAMRLVNLADQALYNAKRCGRNRVVSGGIVPLPNEHTML